MNRGNSKFAPKVRRILSICISRKNTIIGEKSIPENEVNLWKGNSKGCVIPWHIFKKELFDIGANQLANIEINKLYLIICEAIYKDPIAAQDIASNELKIWSALKIKLKRPNFAKITRANADKSIPNKIGKTNLKGFRKGSKYLKELETIGLLKLSWNNLKSK